MCCLNEGLWQYPPFSIGGQIYTVDSAVKWNRRPCFSFYRSKKRKSAAVCRERWRKWPTITQTSTKFHSALERENMHVFDVWRDSSYLACTFFSMQCWCWKDRLLHCSWLPAGHGGERRSGGYFQLHQRAEVSTRQHGPDGGWSLLWFICFYVRPSSE